MPNPDGHAQVLVVDDNERNIRLLESLLSRQGYVVLTASDGLQALEMVHQNLPDLVVLDVMMPGLDGYEVARALRSAPESRAIPVLMLTALREMEDKVRGLEAGADDFLVKPFNAVELLARVRSLLRIKQLTDELQVKNALLERVLTRYVSRDVALEILSNPEQNLQLGGRSCTVSVLFADIRGFTHFSETREAGEVIEMLNYVFNRLTPVVFEHHGMLDKYLGDAIMAVYGAPLILVNGAQQAVITACVMQQRFAQLCRERPLMRELGLGVGISTGEAVVGNIGSDQFMDYTVIGHIPNLAKRLQENAEAGQVLVDSSTYEAVTAVAEAREVLPLYGKGITTPIRAYEVLGLKPGYAE